MSFFPQMNVYVPVRCVCQESCHVHNFILSCKREILFSFYILIIIHRFCSLINRGFYEHMQDGLTTVFFVTLSQLGAQPFDATGLLFGSQAAKEYVQGSQPEWLHMQVGGSFERAT